MVHKGPYETLGGAYRRCSAAGCRRAAASFGTTPVWSFYLNSPQNTRPEDL